MFNSSFIHFRDNLRARRPITKRARVKKKKQKTLNTKEGNLYHLNSNNSNKNHNSVHTNESYH
jgi:hypothetical protein